MKRYLFTLCSMISFGLAAQSLSVHVEDYYYAAAGEECKAKLKVENLTDQDLEVIVTRNTATPSNYMCWMACHTPSVNIASALTISANATVDNFSGYVLSMSEESDVTINYCFSLVNDPGDKICVDVLYTSSSEYLSLQEDAQPNFFVFPNPAQDRLNINFEGGAPVEFVLYNMLGNRVFEDVFSRVKTLDLRPFQSGIYFYTLSVQGKETQVQKLLITHD